MKRETRSGSDPSEAMRNAAMSYPEAQEGIACQGTALEKRTIKVRNKAFLFLSTRDAMLKLHESLADATDLASKAPSRYKVGAHGWVTVTFGAVEALPVGLLVSWIGESYRLLARKQLVALLPERKPPGGKATEPSKATTARKQSARKTKSR
jgi:hypothetical protein